MAAAGLKELAMVRKASLVLIACAGLLAGCQKAPEAAAPGAGFNTTLSTKEVMIRVIDPARYRLWDRVGTVETADGEIKKAPATDQDWNLAENEAAILAEAGNLLLIPSRIQRKDDKDEEWVRITNLMIDLALQEKQAIHQKDTQKMFDLGARVYDEVCQACHLKYMEGLKPTS
jgi:hypothetical protein